MGCVPLKKDLFPIIDGARGNGQLLAVITAPALNKVAENKVFFVNLVYRFKKGYLRDKE